MKKESHLYDYYNPHDYSAAKSTSKLLSSMYQLIQFNHLVIDDGSYLSKYMERFFNMILNVMEDMDIEPKIRNGRKFSRKKSLQVFCEKLKMQISKHDSCIE